MFIKESFEWISDGPPTELVSIHLNELNETEWLSSLPDHGWILIGEKFPFGVCAYYDDENKPDKTIYELSDEENFVDFGIPQSYACWLLSSTVIYETFTRKKYKNSSVASSILFLIKSYVSYQGKNLIAPALMSEDANLLYKNVCDLYGEPYTMDQSHIVPMPEKLFTPWGGKFVR